MDHQPALAAGDRLGIYSYGSGSCAEFYSAIVLDHAQQVVAAARIPEQLNARRALSVAEYEACERALLAATCARDHQPQQDLVAGLYAQHYDGRRRLVFRGTRDYFREYAWS